MLTIQFFRIIKLNLKAPWSPLTHCETQWSPVKRKVVVSFQESHLLSQVLSTSLGASESHCIIASASHCDKSLSEVPGPLSNFCLWKATLEMYIPPPISKSLYVSCFNKIVSLQGNLCLWSVKNYEKQIQVFYL